MTRLTIMTTEPETSYAAFLSAVGGSMTDPKDDAAMLDDMRVFLANYVAYPSEDAVAAHALWIAHTWLATAMYTTPRLAFVSPAKRSGKTRAQEVTALLCPNAVMAVDVSPAYLYRRIQDTPDGYLPTLLIDEADTLFIKGKVSETTEQIRRIINAGYKKGATAGRVSVGSKDPVAKDYPVFAPVCLAGIGNCLPDTVVDRAIMIHMQRRRRDWKLRPYRERIAHRQAEPLRHRLDTWASRNLPRIQEWEEADYPAMPDCIQDRDADVWEPLFIAAALVGGHWPATCAATASRMVAAAHDEPSQSVGERLLADIRGVFAGRSGMFRADLLRALNGMDGTPWADMGKGDGLDARDLTRILRPFGVPLAHSIRIDGQRNWGWYAADFRDAWGRYTYAPAHTPVNGVTDVTCATTPVTTGITGNNHENTCHVTHVTTQEVRQ